MREPIITVQNVSKEYSLGQYEMYKTFRESLVRFAKKPFSLVKKQAKQGREKFFALHDVSFTVQPGERIGIIGRNGAGKSTLLKILSQITSPTTGEIRLHGRIASLLEVGTGFHPELTGRENIYLNGAILGMKKWEIRKKFDEIVAFSEIGKFLDTPVKRYSSGMYVRLAFAVAAHLEPEILIVDEVLAVGDFQFQKKCLGKMQSVANSGRTVIFVSHNLGAVRQLCDRCILLDKGTIIANGPTNEAIERYIAQQVPQERVFLQSHDESKKMHLRKVQLNPQKGATSNDTPFDEDLKIHIEYEVNQGVQNCLVWLSVQTTEGTVAFCTADYDEHPELTEKREPGNYHTDVTIPKKLLAPGIYDVIVGVTNNTLPGETYDRLETIRFEIIDNGSTPKSTYHESYRSGIFQPFLNWETKKVQ